MPSGRECRPAGAVDSSPIGWFRGLLHLPRAGEAPGRAITTLREVARLRGAAALLLAAGAGLMRMSPAPLFVPAKVLRTFAGSC